jgi:methylthioribose-1-phosphate isomerase
MIKPIEWLGDKLRILDQTGLPHETAFIEISDYRKVITAIKELKVRGAPAIGVAAGYGIALGAGQIEAASMEAFRQHLDNVLNDFGEARPTAVNLFHTIKRMREAASVLDDIKGINQALIDEAISIHAEEKAATEKLSHLGAELIKDGFNILTHCNAGPLATAGYGTALGIIITASKHGKNIQVIATETRPLLQGARLTTWELMQENIPVTLITDSMAGHFMSKRQVDCVIVGADRIAANGDTANKIGTYTLAVLAYENRVPFYVAAPTSTIDMSLATGEEILIEERNSIEVISIGGKQIAPQGVKVANPAFDVTPNRYIKAIVTEKGTIETHNSITMKQVFTS